MMYEVHETLKYKGIDIGDATKDDWMLAGLLHDADYPHI